MHFFSLGTENVAFEGLKVREKSSDPLADTTVQEGAYYYDNVTVRGL